MKHAYLIMAHGEWELLQALVGCIDDARNDIYVHIDSKVRDIPELRVEKSRLHFLEKRIDVHWGDVSQIEAEYALFESAAAGHYDYYHLLSGVDLPLKSQDYIHSFFESHEGREFVGFSELEMSPLSVRKVRRYHLFPRSFRDASSMKRVLRAAFLRFQECAHIFRNGNIDFRKGPNWVSITDRMVQLVLSRKDWALHTFKHTFCGDEFLVQTICWNSDLRESIFSLENDAAGCMRAIGWKDGCLYDWGRKDYDMLSGSDALFARKFNQQDPGFIDMICRLSR